MPIFSVGDVKQLTELVIHWKPQINREIIREKARKEFSEEVVGRELSNIYLEFQMKLM
jgi:hypothetical protein